jgi:hypothetical protein
MKLTKQPKRRRAFFGGNDRVEALPEGTLPCPSCGVAVVPFENSLVETITVYGQRNQLGYGTDVDIRVARCDACASRRQLAVLILRDHPAVSREHGSVGVDRVDAALAALDLIGRMGLVGNLAGTDEGVRQMIESFSALGGWASWTAANAAPGVCVNRRWGHVSDDLWRDAGREFADLFRRRLEVPKPVAPPSAQGALSGCAFCGIGTVVVKESNAAAAWGPARQFPLASMGGGGGEVVYAHVCPTCTPALLAAGAVGLPAVWAAVIGARGYVPRSSAGVVSLTGVKPWAAMPRGTEPNATPWAHVDLAALDSELASTTVVRRIESDMPANPVVGWVR